MVCLSTYVVSPAAEAITDAEEGRLAICDPVVGESSLTISPSWVDLEQVGDDVSVEITPTEEKPHQIDYNAANELY